MRTTVLFTSKISSTRMAILIFIIAFIVRLIYVLYAYHADVMSDFSDDIGYRIYGHEVLKQGPFVYDQSNFNASAKVIGPGLPWILAIIYATLGENWLTVFIISALISSFTCVLLFHLAGMLFNRQTALIAGLWSVIYVLYIKYTATSGKDVWTPFLFTLAILLLLRAFKSHRIITSILGLSAVFAFLIHMDERYLAYMPLFIVLLALYDETGIRSGLKKAVVYLILILLLIVPFQIRNYRLFGKFVLMTIRTTGIIDGIFGYAPVTNVQLDEQPELRNLYLYKHEDRLTLTEAQIDSVINLGTRVMTKKGRIDPDQVVAMQQGIIPHKFNFWERAYSAVANLWTPLDLKRSYYGDGYRYDGIWSLKHNLSVGLTYGTMLFFSLLGMLNLFRKKSGLIVLILSFFIMHTIIHVIMGWSQTRYRLPVDSLIISLGSWGLYLFLRYLGILRVKEEN